MMKPQAAVSRHSIILASASPRRRELLTKMGWPFRVVSADVDERVEGAPREKVRLLAERKARAVAQRLGEGVVLAADTLVALDGETLGKPRDAEDARRMLTRLSGRTHEVFTGVCLLNARGGDIALHVERTGVRFRPLTAEEIDAYVATTEPLDKAGAYAIQGGARAFVVQIDGSFDNVMGLPTEALTRMLDAFFARRAGETRDE